jgi:SlyX protein
MALEVKASFTEDLLDELNRTVARQQQQLEALARELVRLRGQVEELGEQDGAGDGTRQEVPPHY